MGACLSDDEVLDATQGRLDPAALRRVEDHVGECADCRVVLAETARALNDGVGEVVTAATIGGATRPARAALLQFLPGAKVARYTIVRPIGMGGAGVVYEAFDPQLERRVALKMVHAGARGAVTADRLLREAQAMARLSHPNVVSVHDAGTHEGEVFLAMEYVDGKTLSRWLRDDKPGPAEVLRVFLEAGRGLASAHAANMIHRDFKPENVLIGADGRVRVTDFGLARSMDVSEPERAELDLSFDTPHVKLRSVLRTLTEADALCGTPAFMAPEQFLGARADARTDQFSFCVALYLALYGRRPFGPDEEKITLLALARDVTAGAIRPPPREARVHGALWPVLQKGLAHVAEARFASMDDLLGALRHAARGGAERRPGRGRRVVVVGLAALGAGAVGAAWILPGRPAPSAAPPVADKVAPPVVPPASVSPPADPPPAPPEPPSPSAVTPSVVATKPAPAKSVPRKRTKASKARGLARAAAARHAPARPPATPAPEKRYGNGLKNPFEAPAP